MVSTHQAVLLADHGVAGEGLGVLVDGELRGRGTRAVVDVEHTAPVGQPHQRRKSDTRARCLEGSATHHLAKRAPAL